MSQARPRQLPLLLAAGCQLLGQVLHAALAQPHAKLWSL